MRCEMCMIEGHKLMDEELVDVRIIAEGDSDKYGTPVRDHLKIRLCAGCWRKLKQLIKPRREIC